MTTATTKCPPRRLSQRRHLKQEDEHEDRDAQGGDVRCPHHREGLLGGAPGAKPIGGVREPIEVQTASQSGKGCMARTTRSVA